MDKLEPCPFCGNPAQKYREMELWKVICLNATCTAHETIGFETPEQAIDAWNKRAIPSIDAGALRPCPFCEGSDIHVEDGLEDFEYSHSWAQCNGCYAFVYGGAKSQESAIVAWNRRPGECHDKP